MNRNLKARQQEQLHAMLQTTDPTAIGYNTAQNMHLPPLDLEAVAYKFCGWLRAVCGWLAG